MITCDPSINFGMPALKSRRLTVYNIITKVYYEETVKIALDDYQISLQDANDAVDYCMNLKCKQDETLIQYCDGCILRTIAEGWQFNKEDYEEFEENDQKFVLSKDKKTFFAGSLREFEDSRFGKVAWLMAEEVNKMLSGCE